MSNDKGFWSYVHKDDLADNQRISQLAKDVVEQYEMITGESIELFLDKDALDWGDNWKDKIDKSLANITFFIPVLTPRYFKSPECRRELHFFAKKATDLGIKELVLPLYYVMVPSLEFENPDDELIKLIKTFQWEDWRELRFSESTSENYRRGVSKLANRLVEANSIVEEADIISNALELENKTQNQDDEENQPGYIDRLAKAEQVMPDLSDTLLFIATEMENIAQIMNDGTAQIKKGNSQNQGFSHRLIIAKSISENLDEPTTEILRLGNQFISQLNDVDEGIKALIKQASIEVIENDGPKEESCELFEVIRNFSASAHQGLNSMQDMVEAIDPLQAMSRDLRPVLRKLRKSLLDMIESRVVTDKWIELINNSGLDCSR